MTAQTVGVTTLSVVRPRQWFGHPRGLTFLFMTEMWERFSYFGISALLVVYMVRYLFSPEHAGDVIGLGAVRNAFESVHGPLDGRTLAALISSTYTAIAFLTPILGGVIADRLLGQRRTALIGACFMASGHFMLASEQLFLVALATLIVGNGLIKPNISTQVGGLYLPDDRRIDRAYSIYYIGINIGAFLAPIVAGTLQQLYGWRYGFIACGIGTLIGITIYLIGWRTLPEGAPAKGKRKDAAPPPLDAQQKRAVKALFLVFIIVTLFWATFDQQYHTIPALVELFADRTVSLPFWRGEIPTPFFLSINPLMMFIVIPVVVRLWAWQAERGTEPPTLVKMGYGFMFVAAAHVVLAVAAWRAGAGGRIGWEWIVAYYAVLTIGEAYFAPVGLALVSKMAPPQLLSMIMGFWLATTFPGDLMAGWLAALGSKMGLTEFFLMITMIAALGGSAMWILGPKIQRIIDA